MFAENDASIALEGEKNRSTFNKPYLENNKKLIIENNHSLWTFCIEQLGTACIYCIVNNICTKNWSVFTKSKAGGMRDVKINENFLVYL